MLFHTHMPQQRGEGDASLAESSQRSGLLVNAGQSTQEQLSGEACPARTVAVLKHWEQLSPGSQRGLILRPLTLMVFASNFRS